MVNLGTFPGNIVLAILRIESLHHTDYIYIHAIIWVEKTNKLQFHLHYESMSGATLTRPFFCLADTGPVNIYDLVVNASFVC